VDSEITQTSDLYFASYLISAGVEFRDSIREGNKVIFVFSHPGLLLFKDLKSGYFSNTAKVPALSYAQSLRFLKNKVSETLKRS
jgi:hypothetical protein